LRIRRWSMGEVFRHSRPMPISKIRKSGTLMAAVMLSEKNNPQESECVTRPMTPEDWVKYGPVNPRKRENRCGKTDTIFNPNGSSDFEFIKNQNPKIERAERNKRKPRSMGLR